jgi:hypothetical protein
MGLVILYMRDGKYIDIMKSANDTIQGTAIERVSTCYFPTLIIELSSSCALSVICIVSMDILSPRRLEGRTRRLWKMSIHASRVFVIRILRNSSVH